MASSLHELLQPQVILEVISRIRKPTSRLQRFFDMQIGGRNVRPSRGRNFSWRIYDHTRTIASGRTPDAPLGTYSLNPIGVVSGVFPRFAEKVLLSYESLNNLSPLAGPNAQVDQLGANYITRQEETLAERFTNAREIMLAGMLTQGSISFQVSGDDWTPVLSLGANNGVTINFQIPAGNQTQLNMLGAGNIIDATWLNASTKIITHLLNINAAMEQLTGRPLAHVWVNSATWANVIGNTQVINAAGSANTFFQTWDWVNEKAEDGKPINQMTAILRGMPLVQWHIYDGGLVINGTDPSYTAGTGTFTKLIPNNTAVFLPEPGPDWVQLAVGSEVVVENRGLPPTERVGFYAWSKTIDDPAAIGLCAVDNLIPALYIPKAIAIGQVVF